MTDSDLQGRLCEAVLADPASAVVLERMPQLALPDWWLTAGAVFRNVWNTVTSRAQGHGIKDYDVFYFDGSDLSWEAEDHATGRPASCSPTCR